MVDAMISIAIIVSQKKKKNLELSFIRTTELVLKRWLQSRDCDKRHSSQ